MTTIIDNDWRAETAQRAVDTFAVSAGMLNSGEDNTTVIGDLLCNLMHLLSREGQDAAHAVGKAYRCYRAEVVEEAEALAAEAAETADPELGAY